VGSYYCIVDKLREAEVAERGNPGATLLYQCRLYIIYIIRGTSSDHLIIVTVILLL